MMDDAYLEFGYIDTDTVETSYIKMLIQKESEAMTNLKASCIKARNIISSCDEQKIVICMDKITAAKREFQEVYDKRTSAEKKYYDENPIVKGFMSKHSSVLEKYIEDTLSIANQCFNIGDQIIELLALERARLRIAGVIDYDIQTEYLRRTLSKKFEQN